MSEQPSLGQHHQQLQRQNSSIKFKTQNEHNAAEPTRKCRILFPLPTIDITIGECIRSIVEDPVRVGLFLNNVSSTIEKQSFAMATSWNQRFMFVKVKKC